MSGQVAPRRSGDTVGAELERRRLVARARRLERLLALLRHRTESAAGPERVGLTRALRDFGEELDAVRARLGRPAGGGEGA